MRRKQTRSQRTLFKRRRHSASSTPRPWPAPQPDLDARRFAANSRILRDARRQPARNDGVAISRDALDDVEAARIAAS